MATPSFRDSVMRVMHEAREHGEHHDAAILWEVLELLQEGRYTELSEHLTHLRPIFRARVGTPPAPQSESGDGLASR